MEWKDVTIKSNDPLTRDTLEAFQRAIKDLAENIADPSGLGIVLVDGGSYTAGVNDRIILCDSRGGQIKIVLQLPRFKQTLTVNKLYKENSVYVVTIDGKPIGNDGASIVVDNAKSFVCDEKQWWRNGA